MMARVWKVFSVSTGFRDLGRWLIEIAGFARNTCHRIRGAAGFLHLHGESVLGGPAFLWLSVSVA